MAPMRFGSIFSPWHAPRQVANGTLHIFDLRRKAMSGCESIAPTDAPHMRPCAAGAANILAMTIFGSQHPAAAVDIDDHGAGVGHSLRLAKCSVKRLTAARCRIVRSLAIRLRKSSAPDRRPVA